MFLGVLPDSDSPGMEAGFQHEPRARPKGRRTPARAVAWTSGGSTQNTERQPAVCPSICPVSGEKQAFAFMIVVCFVLLGGNLGDISLMVAPGQPFTSQLTRQNIRQRRQANCCVCVKSSLFGINHFKFVSSRKHHQANDRTPLFCVRKVGFSIVFVRCVFRTWFP